MQWFSFILGWIWGTVLVAIIYIFIKCIEGFHKSKKTQEG